ncbi:DUF6588 family protein [Algibacter mikhailovii]|uniref:DUF6588 family protein n=1 Tax=Algibacter mikhailovii TaxID=425498 RepID=UPI0024948A4D|nr:DUF6588 family protein [Algibacter mikhailovii]
MKNILLLLTLCFVIPGSVAQKDSSLDALLAAGVEDAQRFTHDYLKPGANGLMHSMNANWFNSAKAKPLGAFEISVNGNYGPIKEEKKMFVMNTDLYNNVVFSSGSKTQQVATILGENNPNVEVTITYDDPIFGNQKVVVDLPSGLEAENVNFIPTAFIQGALGLSHGLEVKARFMPVISIDDMDYNMYGGALQGEFTEWISDDIYMPVSISGLVAYTKVETTYHFPGAVGIAGDNQKVENGTSTWLFQLIGSTRWPIINFYGGIGLISGTSKSDLKGEYIVTNGSISADPIIDPFSVSSNISDFRGTIGTKLKLGFFRLNAEYQISDFDVFSVGVNFGWR